MAEAVRNLPTKVAARLLGKQQTFVYALLQQKRVDWGYAIQSDPTRKRCKYSYFINPRRFAEDERIPLEVVEEAAREYERKEVQEV